MDAIQFSRITAPELLPTPAADKPAAGETGFGDLFREGLDRLDQLEADAGAQVRKLLSGQPVELHRVIMAGEEAGLAFELLQAVRNKVVDAYQEMMRMQV